MTQRAAPAWTKDNADLLKQFLESGTGQIFLANLSAQRPALLLDADVERTALRASSCAGFEKAFTTILSFAEPPDSEVADGSGYADLDRPPESHEQQ